MADGPTPAELRRHPVWQTLSAVSADGLPSEPELDALRLPPAARRKVADAAEATAALRASGENAEARRYSRKVAEAIIDSLPDELRPPTYLRPAEPDTDDPRELAERVRRW